MTDRELKHLSRRELLEILLEQSRRLDRQQQEIEDLRQKLASKELKIQKAGSIAEASLLLSGIFESAQRAADLYLENLRRQERENGREE